MITEYNENYMRNSAQMIGASQTQISDSISKLKALLPKLPKTYQGVLQMEIDSLENHFTTIEQRWKLRGENSETIKQKINNL